VEFDESAAICTRSLASRLERVHRKEDLGLADDGAATATRWRGLRKAAWVCARGFFESRMRAFLDALVNSALEVADLETECHVVLHDICGYKA